MTAAARFLTSFTQALATMSLYREGHPARERAVDAAYASLLDLQAADPQPVFTFLGDEIVCGREPIRELRGWEWSARLAGAGIQRLELEAGIARDELEDFLAEALARLSLASAATAGARQMRAARIRFGSVGVRGTALEEVQPIAVADVSLGVEAETVRWLHDRVQREHELPLAEAETVVRSLAVAMRGDRRMMIPLLRLRTFDEYTTTHALNVAVLAMALSEHIGLGSAEVRAFGLAGLLHDLGKVNIPRDVLNKPGKLTPEEREIINRHPAEGARIIIRTEEQLDLAAVVAYEHHIMLDGGGYPSMCVPRSCHYASRIVHVCDVYDALRTNRPYRDAWPAARVLDYIRERAGTEFDPELARSFTEMMTRVEERAVTTEAQTPS